MTGQTTTLRQDSAIAQVQQDKMQASHMILGFFGLEQHLILLLGLIQARHTPCHSPMFGI